jgi:hypothetical protein
MRSPCCLCVSPINFWMPEPIFMKLHMYIMAPEPIWTAYFVNLSQQSVCLYVYPPPVLLGNGLVNMFPQQRIHITVEEFLDTSFSIPSMSYQRRVCGSVCVSQILVYVLWDSEPSITVLARASRNLLDWTELCIALSLLGNGLVNTFLQQGRIVGGVSFYVVCVV